jgi:hypothetical protein
VTFNSSEESSSVSNRVSAAWPVASAAVCFLAAFPALSADTTPAAAATPAPTPAATSTSLELNKLETYDKGCRAYMVVNNTSDVTYQAYKLDLVLFQADGIIGKRFALDLAPLKPQKKTVKLFELDGVGCDKIGSFLINEVMECKADSGPVADCLQRMSTSSLTAVKISK